MELLKIFGPGPLAPPTGRIEQRFTGKQRDGARLIHVEAGGAERADVELGEVVPRTAQLVHPLVRVAGHRCPDLPAGVVRNGETGPQADDTGDDGHRLVLQSWRSVDIVRRFLTGLDGWR
jgi:hypothetical protein